MNKKRNLKISKAMMGNKNKKGFVYSDELKAKIAKQKKDKGIKTPMLGRKLSENTKRLHRKIAIEKQHHKHFPVLKGVDHPRWRGGVSSLATKIRGLPLYVQWRLNIFRRDHFQCVFCFKGGVLQADHCPKLFRDILIEFNIKTVEDAIKCNALWDITNGRTLCQKHHKEVTREQRLNGLI